MPVLNTIFTAYFMANFFLMLNLLTGYTDVYISATGNILIKYYQTG